METNKSVLIIHVVTIREKSAAETAVAMAVAKCQQMAALLHVVLTITKFVGLPGYFREPCFLSEIVTKRYTRHEDYLERRPKN